MRFALTTRGFHVNVRTRLTMAFLLVTTLSWLLGFLTLRVFMAYDIARFNREMASVDARARLKMGPMGHLSYGPFRPESEAHGAAVDGGRYGPPPSPPDGHRPPPGGMPRPFYQNIFAQGVISVVLALLAGWWLSRFFTKPLAALAKGARQFRHRQLTYRIPVHGDDEFADVAEALNEMAAQIGEQITALEEDAHRRQQVLADVAHELRSPVATLEAMSVAMRDGLASSPERQTEALSFMIDSAGRMRRLVDDLLEVARLDLHELPLVCAPVDLREMVEDSMSVHRRAADQNGVCLVPPEKGDPVVVEADRLRLAQVLDNLLGNAIAYAGAGAEVRVHVSADPPSIVVEDTGVGIAEKHLPFIFDPFYRADRARTPGDNHSGLGLRIARGLVEAHGGTMTLHSEEGQGTRVTVELPSVQPAKKG